MMSALASALGAGALVAVAALHFGADAARLPLRVWPASQVQPATEEAAICTSPGQIAFDSGLALDPDFAAGREALARADWAGAIAALKLAAVRDPRSADIANYIGFAYARLRQAGPAMGYYQQAVMYNPRHRAARKHLGELYLVLGEPNQAQEQLARIEDICLLPCEEYADLRRAIATYKSRMGS